MNNTQICGRSLSDIADITYVMEKHRLSDAAALDRALTAKKAPEVRITVVDTVNPKRVLGFLTQRPCALRGRYLEVAVRPPMRVSIDFDAVETTFQVSRIRFEIDHQRSDCGWEVTPVLKTDAKLDELMKLDFFLLPGETQQQARERRFRY